MARKTRAEVTAETPAQEEPQTKQRSQGPALNRVELIGRLATDPETREVGEGVQVANFRLATNGGGEAQFHAIVACRGLAGVVGRYLAKGRLVHVAGRLQYRSWTGQDGVQRYAAEIVAEDVQILSPKQASPEAA